MRLSILLTTLVLPLLAGCVESNYLVTSSPAPGPDATDNLRAPAWTYTSHLARITDRPEVVQLRVDDSFSPYERVKILRAVNEWNHVLNGYVRLDIVSGSSAAAPRRWSVLPARGGAPGRRPGADEALAITQPLPSGGGLVVVFADRLGRRDLGSVIRHELGHVLGLGHDPRGGLMATHYAVDRQHCVDRTAAEAIAANRKLPVATLNWCEEAAAPRPPSHAAIN